MSKLFKFKPWLSIAEAAHHLSMIFEEPVLEKDVLRLSLDGKIVLSVVFPDAPWGELFEEVEMESIEYVDMPSLDGNEILRIASKSARLAPNGSYIQSTGKRFMLEDEWPYDLPMIGGEVGDIKHKYWQQAGGEREQTISIDGTFVRDSEKYISLLEHYGRSSSSNFFPMGGLPDNCLLVVTPKSLAKFESLVSAPMKSVEEKPLGSRERTNLHNIIGSLLACLKHHRVDEAAVKTFLEEQRYTDIDGVSIRNLEKVFPLARKGIGG